jgi:threonine synthase
VSSITLACLDCCSESQFDPLSLPCPACAGEWRQATYDFQSARRAWQENLHDRPFDMWRYRELLPVAHSNQQRPVGGTPLYKANHLGKMLGLKRLYVKDERVGPTGSFKDRQAALTVAVLLEFNLREAVICSTGNVAISFAAACAQAGIRLWVFLTSLVPAEKMHEVALYGTEVVKVTGTYDQSKLLAAQFAAQRGIYLDRGGRSIAAVESMKTIAFEIAEQLEWQAPDWYIQPVSGGLGPLGVKRGFAELRELGLVSREPALGIIQAAGCSPMVSAWAENSPVAKPVQNPSTYITTLSTGDPGRTYSILREHMQSGAGGTMAAVTDEESFRALHLLAKVEGISVEPAAAAGVAGLLKLAGEGEFKEDDIIVLNLTGHTMPVEANLLAPDWSIEVDLDSDQLVRGPREGVLAALSSLDQKHLRRVLLVDDQPDARRLIRRVLEARGSYHIDEAGLAIEALTIADQRPPDLIILDLMMPEMDGFALLDQFKQRQHTRDIPVIVVTAKELTAEEYKSLEGQIMSLIQKGNFLSDELLDEIELMLNPQGGKPA